MIVIDSTWNRFSLLIQQSGSIHKAERGKLLLNTGLDAFAMQVACLSIITNDRYRITASNSRAHQAQTVPLRNTLCRFAVKQDNILTGSNMLGVDWQRYHVHPLFRFAAYIVAPVRIDGTIFGTLFFGSAVPRKQRFTERDKSYMKMLSGGFSAVIKQGLAIVE